MKKTAMTLKPKFKLWLSNDKAEGVFGDGKWRLLKAVKQKGSLKSAAESLGISYRKAWGDIKKAEEHLGVILLERRHGGKAGGSAHLTEKGRTWLREYSHLRSEMEKTAAKAFREHIAGEIDSR